MGDEYQNDLRGSRAALLKRLFPFSIRGLKVLATNPARPDTQSIKFYVKLTGTTGSNKDGGAIVTIASADTVRVATERLELVRKAALNAQRVVPEMRPPVYEGELGAMAQRALMCNSDLAPTFADELKYSLLERRSPGFSLVPLPRHIWQRGSPLHEMAVESATRGIGFFGPNGLAHDMLTLTLFALAGLMPAPLLEPEAPTLGLERENEVAQAEDEAGASEEEPPDEAADGEPDQETAAAQESAIDVSEIEADDSEAQAAGSASDRAAAGEAHAAFAARCASSLLNLVRELETPEISEARADPITFQRGLFARCGTELLTDAACDPLVQCISRLRDAAAAGWQPTAANMPLWVQSWRPLRVQCHGDLRGTNLLVDEARKLHLIGLGKARVAPIFFDVARLISHCIVACVSVDAKGDTTGTGSASSSGTGAGGTSTEGSSASIGASGALVAESRLEMLCSAINVLLPTTSGSSCCHDSLLVLGALPIADLVPESTPEDIKAVLLICQQMIESACKTTLAAAAHVGKVDEHDLHPINLLLPLLVHSLSLCGDTEASVNQQRVAWHLVQRSSSLAATFLGSGLEALPKRSDQDLARRLQAVQREADEVRRDAEGSLAFQKALVDRLTAELEQAKGAAATPAKGSGQSKSTPAASEKKPAKMKGESPAKKSGGGKKKSTTERKVEFSSA